uniref:DNA 3'-5' helicase n=1 Tax=Alphapolyomavirus callosciuri TaxID=2721748 RepID=A0A6G9LW67_9POLY|nr:large T antigen [Alphapolyomavirus callosciuri]
MDRILEREERKKLVELLGIDPVLYGNIPVMKSAYKRASKVLHPDKGGTGNDMMILNFLWQKFQEGVTEARCPEEFSSSYGSRSYREHYREWCSSVFTNESTKEGPDLHCDESISEEEEDETQESGYNSFPFTSTPTPQASQGAPPFPENSSSSSSFSGSRAPTDEGNTPKKRRRASADMDGSNSSSQASFASTPPKAKGEDSDKPSDVPPCLHEYISHALFSNKTVNSFLLYSTVEKATLLYDKIDKFKVEFKSLHSYDKGALLLILTAGKHRLTAIKNYCHTFCTVSFLVCKMVLKPLELYNCLCKDPFKEIKASKEALYSFDFDEKTKEEACNWNKVAEFAVQANIDDPLLILAHYLDFAKPHPCNKCLNPKSKAHDFHKAHHLNALSFENSKSQRSICNQASDVVLAKRRLILSECTREELLGKCFEKQLKILQSMDQFDILYHMAGVAWYSCLMEQFDSVLYKILKLLTENIPKQRNILFRGPVNSGKTTLAAALMDLVEGKSLNINCPGDKLNFELGCAIDRFAVVFEDVKGQVMHNKKLQPGQGINNLDNMRDYLDGAVPVNLERKHVNKRSQIFPPSIVTMNEYFLPQTLFVRFALKIDFKCKHFLNSALEKAPFLLSKRILQKGITLFLLLLWYLPAKEFLVSLQPEVALWKTIIEKTVKHSDYCKMVENIEVGENPLFEIVIEEEDTENEV